MFLYCYFQCSFHQCQSYMKHGLHKAIMFFHRGTVLYLDLLQVKDKLSKQKCEKCHRSKPQSTWICVYQQAGRPDRQESHKRRMRTYLVTFLHSGISTVSAKNKEINWLLIWLGFNQIDRIHDMEVFVSACKKIKLASKKKNCFNQVIIKIIYCNH